MIIWIVPVFVLPLLVLFVACALSFITGYGLILMFPWLPLIVVLSLVPMLLYVVVHSREYKDNPYCCVVCGDSLPNNWR